MISGLVFVCAVFAFLVWAAMMASDVDDDNWPDW